MAICMTTKAGHVHENACDHNRDPEGRNTTVVSVRLPDDLALRVRKLAGSRESVNEYLVWLVDTQAARKR